MATYNIKADTFDTARPVRIIDASGYKDKTRVGMMFMRKGDKNSLWFNSDPITLTSDFVLNSKMRKEQVKEWKRILNDLEKAPVYKQNSDGSFTYLGDKNDNTNS